jgi:hypothetical protein
MQNEYLAIKPIGGIGTRIHCIASYFAISQYLKLPLLVYWCTSRGFNETPWLDLFQKPDNFELIDETQWEAIRCQSVNLDTVLPFLDEKKSNSNFSIKWLYQGRFRQVSIITGFTLTQLDSGAIYKFIPYYDKVVTEWIKQFKIQSKI